MYAGHFDFTKPLFWTVDNLYSEAECAAILRGAVDGPWLAATVNRSEGRRVDARVRNNTVAVLRDSALAVSAFERVKPHVPKAMTTEIESERVELAVRGVHLPLRIYRYEVGQFFGVHEDQSYFAEDGSQSLLTFMVYLNDDFEGGETEFVDHDARIVPKTGMALLFQHRVLHAGLSVTKGTKNVLRSDVLYRRAV